MIQTTHKIVDNKVLSYTKILVYTGRSPSFHDNYLTRIYHQRLVLKDWFQTESGKWINNRVDEGDIEVTRYFDPITMDNIVNIVVNLNTSDATFFRLKWGSQVDNCE